MVCCKLFILWITFKVKYVILKLSKLKIFRFKEREDSGDYSNGNPGSTSGELEPRSEIDDINVLNSSLIDDGEPLSDYER